MARLERNMYTQTEYKKTPGSNKFFDNRTSSQLLTKKSLSSQVAYFCTDKLYFCFCLGVERNDVLLVKR